MIVGFGCDLVDIRRIEKALAKRGARFEEKLFTEAERQTAALRKKAGKRIIASYYAKRYAAKEAFMKALGSGFRNVSWHEMQVVLTKTGAPVFEVSGKTARQLAKIMPDGATPRLWLTLTDDYPYAQAQLIIEAVHPAPAGKP